MSMHRPTDFRTPMQSEAMDAHFCFILGTGGTYAELLPKFALSIHGLVVRLTTDILRQLVADMLKSGAWQAVNHVEFLMST